MATIHQTTLVPSKLELLAGWLPEQDWYRNHSGGPNLTRAGGFRLDDPAGEVGIEFMVVLDEGGDSGRTGDIAGATAYLVPLTYRASPLPGGDDALIGQAVHGVLGPRWIYDGTRDPVLLAALAEFIAGRVQAQAQRVSNTPDLTVLTSPVPGAPGDRLDIRFARLLAPAAAESAEPGQVSSGQVSAQWTGLDGKVVRGVFATSNAAPG